MRPWGLAAYIHIPSHKYGKLGPRGRKYIFIRYNEHSKGYVFIGEHEDGKVTELESRDATFLEEDFPCMGEIERDLHLYDMMDLGIISTPKQQLMPEPSRSELVPVTSTMNESILRKSYIQIIPWWWFKIEGEVHIVTQYDDAEPKSVQEALTCPTKDE